MKYIIKFITYEEANDKLENGLGGMGGWFDNGMRWEDYKQCFQPEYHKELEHLRKKIIKHGIKCSGDTHQHSNFASVPLWSDDTVDTYSYRAWGDLMAAIWSSQDNEDYCYMDFYM